MLGFSFQSDGAYNTLDLCQAKYRVSTTADMKVNQVTRILYTTINFITTEVLNDHIEKYSKSKLGRLVTSYICLMVVLPSEIGNFKHQQF